MTPTLMEQFAPGEVERHAAAVRALRDCAPQRCPKCGLLFYDTSRNKNRKWCSMKTCGNRVKAATHRAKRERIATEMLESQRLAEWQAVAGQEFPHLMDVEGPTRYTETE